MKKILFTFSLFLIGFVQYSSACNNSTISIASQVDNMDGTFTYTLDLTVELGNFDQNFYGFVLAFTSSQNTPTVTSFSASIPANGALVETLTGLTGSDVNSLAGDSAWNPYLNRTDLVSYEFNAGPFDNGASNDFTVQINVTVDGCVEEIIFDASVNSESSSCEIPASTGVNCAVCDITNVTNGTQVPCVPATNTYTQDVTVTYINPPATGTLDVNGQSFAIGTSPQTVTLTGLTADGAVVNGTVEFSDDTPCNDVVSFTAPAACSITCSVDNVTNGTQSACNPATNTYTQQVTITYSSPPASGTLDINGQSFAITSSPQTETLTGLVANGAAVNGTVEFSADTNCNDTVSFTAPASCSVGCAADNGTWN
jgi:hypothetical protein